MVGGLLLATFVLLTVVTSSIAFTGFPGFRLQRGRDRMRWSPVLFGASEDEAAGRAFYEAASKGNMAKLQALADDNPGKKNVLNFKVQERYGRTPLVIASYYGKLEAVKFLLATKGVDPNMGTAYGATPLHFAAHRGHLDVVNVLLADRRVKVNAKATGGKWTGYSVLDVCSGMGMAGKPAVIAAIKAKGGKAGKGGGQ